MAVALTPMMKQYLEAKQACPDALLLFRMGDFYELFHEDAKIAARTVHLALTSRDKGANAVPMAGFPYHQLESYLAKLITAGLRVAVCEQVEDPKQAKGLVRREITRVVTPGTVTDDALLDPRQSNYLAAVCPGEPTGIAWVELSTGRFVAGAFAEAEVPDQLARIGPSECLASESSGAPPLSPSDGTMLTRRPDWAFAQATAEKTLADHFGTATLEGFGFQPTEGDRRAVAAAGAVLDYLTETQRGSLAHIDRLISFRQGTALEIDEATWRSLEITRTLREGRREGSLLHVLDQTVTAMGSRLLAEWLSAALTDRGAIDERLDAVEELLGDVGLCEALAEALRGVYDLPRLLTRVSTGRASPRDLAFVGRTLRALPGVKAKLTARKCQLLDRIEVEIDLCADLRSQLDAALIDDCPLSPRDGAFIREGFHEELDALRGLAVGGKQWIAEYQATQARRTGIPTLKVGFNKVFGYYIEITNAHRDKIPPDFHRKQTLKNAERYITPELKEYEEKVLTADEKAKQLEYDLFLELRDAVGANRRRMHATASVLATIDVLVALAELARRRNYCRPRMTDEPGLAIIDGRHPVLDVTEPEGTFVPNDTHAGEVPEDQPPSDESAQASAPSTMLLITGPNMAGKSTYIRQVALITLMAQIGSFVPASKATVGVADRIFARVGASDELSRGRSTFMVEMTETARILNTATHRSLVILDEIGRGTSTYDGISLAWSVVEHLHDHVGCRTLFATHYHELTDLEQSLSGVKNLNVSVKEWEDEVVFLHKIVPGAADKSYGIHVARLAGVPREVIQRARDILARLEDEHLDATGRAKIARPPKTQRAGDIQLTLFGPADHPLLDEIRSVELAGITPLEAMQRIEQWQAVLASEKSP